MKKYLALILISIFLISCSNNSLNNDTFGSFAQVDNEKDLGQKYKKLYDNWELTQLQNDITEDETIYKSSTIIEKYKILLQERITLKNDLLQMLNIIENELSNGNTTTLENSLSRSVKNSALKKQLQKVDFSYLNVFVGDPKFFKQRANGAIAINFQDNTIYYDVDYTLKKTTWKITKFKEKN